MSKTIRFALMLALTALAAWTSTPKAAYALPRCAALQGETCFASSVQCTLPGTIGHGVCICDTQTDTFDCF